jgi:hypothetical protein
LAAVRALWQICDYDPCSGIGMALAAHIPIFL